MGMDVKVIQAVHATGLAGPGLIESGREQRPWLVVWVSVKGESGGHLHPHPPAGGDAEVQDVVSPGAATVGSGARGASPGMQGKRLETGAQTQWVSRTGVQMREPSVSAEDETPGVRGSVWRETRRAGAGSLETTDSQGFSLEKVLRVMRLRLRKTKQLFHDL